MAKKQGFDLAAVLGGVSNLDTEEQIVRLPLDLLDPDPENFYSLDGLDELAGNIELLGLMDPIRVRPNGERYTVVSGHRRRAAIMLIRDGGSDQFADGVPCIVEYGEASDAMRRLRLIYANASTRQLTSAEQSRQAEEVTRILYELKEQGVEFPGRMREHVAQACGVTQSKIARLHAIRENLKPELLNLYDRGTIKEAAAYELQKLPMDVQRYLAGKKKISDGCVRSDGLKLCVERSEAYLHPTCKCPDGSACGHTLPRFYQTAITAYYPCKGECCLKCRYTESDCPYQCTLSKKKTEERRAKDRAQKEKEEQSEKQRRDNNRAKLAGQFMSLAVLAKSAGLKDKDYVGVPGASTLRDLEAKASCPDKIGDYEARDSEVFDKYTYIGTVRDFADKVNVSVDFLLGRTQIPEIAGTENRAFREAPLQEDGAGRASPAPAEWQKGTPPTEGWYAVKNWYGGEKNVVFREIMYWKDRWSYSEKSWHGDPNIEVFAWYPLPPDPLPEEEQK